MDFVVAFVFWLLFTTLYLGPSVVAVCRHHHYTPQIVAINIFLGWTIVGLFWAFAWALSSTRSGTDRSPDQLPTDFAERFFQNRNVIRQPDGGAIVYPGFLSDDAFWLSAREFQTYLQMREAESRRNFPRALLLLIGGAGSYLAFRQWMGPEHGTAPAVLFIISFTLAVTAWDLVFRPRRRFVSAFPKAPKTRDPIRPRRKILAGLVAFDPMICVGATLLCFGLIASFALSLWQENQFPLLRSQDGAMLILGFAFLSIGGALYAQLVWHHARFFLENRRTPNQFDLDVLGTGVKALHANARQARVSPSNPMAAARRNGRGLAAALRSSARQH